MNKTKLTQREASHFIATAIASKKTDLKKKKKRRGQRKGLEAPCPRGLPFIA
jgi:hypothetical protein